MIYYINKGYITTLYGYVVYDRLCGYMICYMGIWYKINYMVYDILCGYMLYELHP